MHGNPVPTPFSLSTRFSTPRDASSPRPTGTAMALTGDGNQPTASMAIPFRPSSHRHAHAHWDDADDGEDADGGEDGPLLCFPFSCVTDGRRRMRRGICSTCWRGIPWPIPIPFLPSRMTPRGCHRPSSAHEHLHAVGDSPRENAGDADAVGMSSAMPMPMSKPRAKTCSASYSADAAARPPWRIPQATLRGCQPSWDGQQRRCSRSTHATHVVVAAA
mmetsp:Transcript_12221/g.31074  ORF Transcript_12221/g.31074 Transcript_12221/m.31074 type:complete len:218 (-) Transcript_12221:320-973(-)